MEFIRINIVKYPPKETKFRATPFEVDDVFNLLSEEIFLAKVDKFNIPCICVNHLDKDNNVLSNEMLLPIAKLGSNDNIISMLEKEEFTKIVVSEMSESIKEIDGSRFLIRRPVFKII